VFPVNNAVFPRLTQLVAIGDVSELTVLYHRSCQIIAVFILPVGLILAFFSKELMLIWTGNATTAENTYLLVTALVTGTTLMGLMMIPYSLQLAFAWTRLGLFLNIISIIIILPSLFWLVSVYGAFGACFVWIAIYTVQVFVMIHYMHRRILKGEKWKWYVNDVVKPLIPPLIIVAISRQLLKSTMSTPFLISSLVVIFLVSVCSSAMSSNQIRMLILTTISSMRRRLSVL